MPALKKIALTVTSAALLSTFVVVPASAVDQDTSDNPKPTAPMSKVGGERLARIGTQVELGPGAPVLPKDLAGRSWIVADAESGEVLASHNPHWRLPPASTLKMLFADTIMESPELQPKTMTHKVSNEDLAGIGEGSSLVGVKEHQTYTVHDLWLGVFLRSGNDAVHVLSSMYGGVPKTVAAMQEHAEELQALDTQVVSPDGYDAPEQVSSAYDLTLFARSGLQKADFREYCSTAAADFPGEEKEGKKRESFQIQNTNRLLTGDAGVVPYKGIAGVKNGYTTHAGNTFTGVAERNGKVLLVTVMNPSSDEAHAVYKEAASLLDWGFDAAGKVTPVGELVPPKSAETGVGKGSESAGGTTAADDGKKGPAATHASAAGGSSGIGVALGITGGVLALLAAGVFLVNRRWPLPDLVRRLPRR
ncbi:D-alanyl-D-alanine carboxypeptidase family protein [Streptomyces sp. NBC_00316]|uniref:D-alanyl-D-alanine carboxypeptidase family protein n=1 Tax=Streptomyces sp. NBC_00316 TaxID=2975710 RepID=UPI002E2840E5|nr:D-alanyl-D-alanine carboxypeptidase [Streptomyces sp. NBC_00316]